MSQRGERRQPHRPSTFPNARRVDDVAGRRYMNFHGNNVHHIGYGHPRLIGALKRQLDELPFSPRRFTNETAIALARKLADITPGDLGKVLFSPSGSDAIDMALKVARAATETHGVESA